MILTKMVGHALHFRCRILTFIASVSFHDWNALDSPAYPYTLDPVLCLCNGHSIALKLQKCQNLPLCCSNSMVILEMRWNPFQWNPNSTIIADNQIVEIINRYWHVNGTLSGP